MGGPIGLHRPTSQQQHKDDTEHFLFLFGEEAHAGNIQCFRDFQTISNNDVDQLAGDDDHPFDGLAFQEGLDLLTRHGGRLDFGG